MAEAAAAPHGMLEALRRFRANSQWANLHADELRPFEGRCVAIDGGRVVADAPDIAILHEKFADRKDVFITFVAPLGLSWVL